MLSAVIPSERSQPAVLLSEQLAHQRFVRPGPLVLRTALLKSPARAADRDRTVSRRSKPSSRTALMGEQPNPWDRLQPHWRASFKVSHLSYTSRTEHQYQAIVKVPGSFRPAARNEHLYS